MYSWKKKVKAGQTISLISNENIEILWAISSSLKSNLTRQCLVTLGFKLQNLLQPIHIWLLLLWACFGWLGWVFLYLGSLASWFGLSGWTKLLLGRSLAPKWEGCWAYLVLPACVEVQFLIEPKIFVDHGVDTSGFLNKNI